MWSWLRPFKASQSATTLIWKATGMSISKVMFGEGLCVLYSLGWWVEIESERINFLQLIFLITAIQLAPVLSRNVILCFLVLYFNADTYVDGIWATSTNIQSVKIETSHQPSCPQWAQEAWLGLKQLTPLPQIKFQNLNLSLNFSLQPFFSPWGREINAQKMKNTNLGHNTKWMGSPSTFYGIFTPSVNLKGA